MNSFSVICREISGLGDLDGISVPRAHELHVWVFIIPALISQDDISEHVLDRSEILRARSYRFDRDRLRFAVRRGMLRQVLGKYCGVSPELICFRQGVNGKPELADEKSGLDVQFNLSHFGDVVCYAVTAGCAVGVDIEMQRPVPDALTIAKRFFAPDEWADLAGLPGAEREQAFFRCWTRKEAVLKATGVGLAGLDRFSVSVRPGGENILTRCESQMGRVQDWFLVDLPEFVAGCHGAVAVQVGSSHSCA